MRSRSAARAGRADRAADLSGGARRTQGAADEGRAVARDHPRRAAAGICDRAVPAAVRCAADGLRLRLAGAWRPSSGRTGSRNSGRSRRSRRPPRRSDRCTARRRSMGLSSRCKLQYPDMASAVEADLGQLGLLFDIRRRFDSSIDTSQIVEEIGARIREELDYRREAKHAALYGLMLEDTPEVRVPGVHPELSTGRLLTLDWLEGRKLLEFKQAPLDVRNRLAVAMFKAWWGPFSSHRRHPRRSASRQLRGVFGRRRAAGHQSARLWLHPHVSAEIRRRRRRPLRGSARRRRRARGARLRGLGLQGVEARADRRAQHLGALHLRPAARRPGAHHRGRGVARRIRPQAGLPGRAGAEDQRAR